MNEGNRSVIGVGDVKGKGQLVYLVCSDSLLLLQVAKKFRFMLASEVGCLR